MIIEPNASRIAGRIAEVFPGADGLVRVARVHARGKEYLRSVHCRCPLEYARRRRQTDIVKKETVNIVLTKKL